MLHSAQKLKTKYNIVIMKLKKVPFHCSSNAPGNGILCLDLRGVMEGIPSPSLG